MFKAKLMMIDKDKLIIPTDDYQRDESKGRLAKEIALHLDPVAFGALTVVRENGHYNVDDGGTRLSGARMREDVKAVPCLVFPATATREQEADTFLRINKNRKRLSTDQEHHAELYAQHELAIEVDAHERTMSEHRVGFGARGELRRCVLRHHDATATIVSLLLHSAHDKQVSAKVLKGLVALEVWLAKSSRTLQTRGVVKSLQENFGHLDAAVNAAITTQSRGDVKTLARAIAKTLRVSIPRG